MEENMNIPQDELTQRIVSRLGERQQKLELMAQWEKSGSVDVTPASAQEKHKARIRSLYYITVVAACIAIVLWMVPWGGRQDLISELGIGTPELTAYRAANAETEQIDTLIKDEKYQDALNIVTTALKKSEAELEVLEDFVETQADDESLYELDAEMQLNSELRWTRIYLLLKLDMKKEARKEVKDYLRYPDYCQHLDEAKALKKTLN